MSLQSFVWPIGGAVECGFVKGTYADFLVNGTDMFPVYLLYLKVLFNFHLKDMCPSE